MFSVRGAGWLWASGMNHTLTGVGAVFSAAHRDASTGNLHGHSWEVTVWLTGRPDAGRAKVKLDRLLAAIDHTELPASIAWGEDMARWIAERWADSACVRVDISRPLERLYARWVR